MFSRHMELDRRKFTNRQWSAKKEKEEKKGKKLKNEGYYLPYGASYNRCHLCWNHHFSYPRNLQVNR